MVAVLVGAVWWDWGVMGSYGGLLGVIGVPGKVFGSCLSVVGGGTVATGSFTSGGIKAVKFTNNV